MARTDFTSVREAFDNLITTLNSATQGLLNKANSDRESLIAIYRSMQDTAIDAHELSALIGDATEQLDALSDLNIDIYTKVQHTIYGGYSEVPACPYEKFIEFCDECGHSISSDEHYDYDGDWYRCNECLAAQETEDEGETVELAESVAADA